MLSGIRAACILQRRLGCRFCSTGNDSPLRRLIKDARVGGESVPSDPELQWATEPYLDRESAREQPRLAGDGTVLLFPGQGTQYVGMGRRAANVPAAKDLYDEASEVLGWNVFRVCTEGPAEQLEANLQPALLVTSLAALALATEERPAAVERAVVAAGFSLGEWAALVWAGALTFPAALRAVEVRGRAMAAAAAARPGGMLCVWLQAAADLPALLQGARDAGPPAAVCSVAAYLHPGCRVLAGDLQCLQWVERQGAAAGVRRSARLGAAGAWHCALVAGAGAALAAALQEERARGALRAPRRRVLSAAAARAYRGAADVQRLLTLHVAAPQRWEQTLQLLYARPKEAAQPLTLALGPGAAHRNCLRKINAKAWDSSVLIEI